MSADDKSSDPGTHLADRSIPIGILPLGSATNITRSLGIAGTPAELAEQWRARHVHSFHLVEITHGKCKRRLCTEGFGVGLVAALIKRRAKGKRRMVPTTSSVAGAP